MYSNYSNLNYQQFCQPPTETYPQQLIKNVDSEARCTWQQNTNVNSGYPSNLQLVGVHWRVLRQPVGIVQQAYDHPLNIPNNMVAGSFVHMMTVEQTANWIWTFSVNNGWDEALAYATSFRRNCVNGEMLRILNHEILKFDIGMSNHTHRLVLMTVIQKLFPLLNNHQGISKPTRLSDVRQTEIRCDHRQELSTSQIAGNLRANEDKQCIVKCLVPGRDRSLGTDLFCTNTSTMKSVSTESGSAMELSPRSSRSKRSYSSYKLKENRECKALWTVEQTPSLETASPMQESFGDIRKLCESGRYCPLTAPASMTPANEQKTKLILTHPLGNFLKIKNIRDHFEELNCVVAVERLHCQSFLIIFQSTVEAMWALKNQCQIGYLLHPLKDMELSTRHAQMPATNCRFLSPDTVICDKLFKWQFPGSTDGDGIVTINNSKGCNTVVGHRRGEFCGSNSRMDLLSE